MVVVFNNRMVEFEVSLQLGATNELHPSGPISQVMLFEAEVSQNKGKTTKDGEQIEVEKNRTLCRVRRDVNHVVWP
jgi:hypothetical protein